MGRERVGAALTAAASCAAADVCGFQAGCHELNWFGIKFAPEGETAGIVLYRTSAVASNFSLFRHLALLF